MTEKLYIFSDCKQKYLGVAHEKFGLTDPCKRILPCCTNLLPCLSVCMFSLSCI